MDYKLVSDLLPENIDSKKNTISIKTYTEQFYEAFPFFLSIGMTYDMYWNEDCMLVKYYKQSFRMQQDRKNEELWLQGYYFYEALCDVSPILQAFAKNGTKPLSYLKEPIPRNAEELEEKKEHERKTRVEKARARMLSLATKNIK